jgi:hypothetical protein
MNSSHATQPARAADGPQFLPRRRQGLCRLVAWLAFMAAACSTYGSPPAATAPSTATVPVAVVILSPQVSGPGEPNNRVAAELVCDELARELGKHLELRVVDRTQLDRVLAETKLSAATGAASGPSAALAYDFMVRLRVDTARPIAKAALELIDLSRGNIVRQKEYLWSAGVNPSTVADMARLCAEGAAAETSPRKAQVRVRFFGVEGLEIGARLEPPARRLEEVIREGLARSPGVEVVLHLEAGTSKEESLLLLMGMSRLAGGRTFAPAADTLLRIRVREVDPEGKTFENTPAEVSYCLDAGGPPQWKAVNGTLVEWDKLVASAWKAIAADIPAVGPRAGADLLDDMALRRSRAEAELAKIIDWNLSSTDSYRTAQHLAEMRDAAAVACKLDPSFELPAFYYVESLYQYNLRAAADPNFPASAPEFMVPVLREGLNYLKRFPPDSYHWPFVIRFTKSAFGWKDRQGRSAADYDPEALDMMRQVVETELAQPGAVTDLARGWRSADSLYQKMLLQKLPAQQCAAWRDRMFELADAQLRTARKRSEHNFAIDFPRIRFLEIGYAIKENSPARARDLLAGLMNELPDPGKVQGFPRDMLPQFVEQAKNTGDEELAKRVGEWANVGKPRLQSDTKPVDPADTPIEQLPAVSARLINVRAGGESIAPCVLGELGARLFVMFNPDGYPYCDLRWSTPSLIPPKSAIGWFPLDKDGGPAGKLVTVTPPKDIGDLHVRSAAVLAGKVFLATDTSGLVAYEPNKDKWTHYGIAEGLPHLMQQKLMPLDDRRLMCMAGKYGGEKLFIYTLDVVSQEVTLLRTGPGGFLASAWRDGNSWVGISFRGIFDDPLGAEPKLRPKSIYSDMLAVVNGRYFLRCFPGMCEISVHGDVLRRWARIHLGGESSSLERKIGYDTKFIGEMMIGHSDSCLFFRSKLVYDQSGSEHAGIVCYDPQAEMWYGPLQIKPSSGQAAEPGQPGFKTTFGCSEWCTSGRNGVWIMGGSVAYVAAADVIEAARKAGRVMTSDQLEKQLKAEANSPEKAKRQ